MKGDAILVDLDRVARDPWIDPEFEIADAFVERAMGADVATVVIRGKIVVENHQRRTHSYFSGASLAVALALLVVMLVKPGKAPEPEHPKAEAAKPTGLYDRRSDDLSLDEVEQIGI
jgi:hypothetical protein